MATTRPRSPETKFRIGAEFEPERVSEPGRYPAHPAKILLAKDEPTAVSVWPYLSARVLAMVIGELAGNDDPVARKLYESAEAERARRQQLPYTGPTIEGVDEKIAKDASDLDDVAKRKAREAGPKYPRSGRAASPSGNKS